MSSPLKKLEEKHKGEISINKDSEDTVLVDVELDQVSVTASDGSQRSWSVCFCSSAHSVA